MSLRNQPYFPFYVKDFMSDEKLAICEPASIGVYIYILCVMHKFEDYGKIKMKAKFKQNTEQIKNFASYLLKFLPFDLQDIESGLSELIEEEVLYIEDDYLIQKRMVKDGEISKQRALAGSLTNKNKQNSNLSSSSLSF